MNPPEWPRERRDGYRRSRALGRWLVLFALLMGLCGIVLAARVLGAFL